MYVSMYVCVYLCIYVYMYVCMYVCMDLCIKKNLTSDFQLMSFTAGHLGMPLIPRRPVM